MVLLIEAVVYEPPVPNKVPLVAASYHESVPVEAVALRLTVPEPQTEPGVVLVIAGVLLMVAVTAERAEVQLPLEVST